MASVNKFWRKKRKSGEGKGGEEEKNASATDGNVNGKELHMDLEHAVSKRWEGKESQKNENNSGLEERCHEGLWKEIKLVKLCKENGVTMYDDGC